MLVLSDGPLPCFWRAPTDNDKGGSLLSYNSQWKACGLDTLMLTGCEGFRLKKISDQVISLSCVIFIEPKGKEPPPPQVSGSQAGNIDTCREEAIKNQVTEMQAERAEKGVLTGFKIKVEYKVFGNGNLIATYDVQPSLKVSTLPRVGVQFNIDKDCSQVEWYGRGPFECYPDRKSAAWVGIYNKNVEDLHVPYIVPGESGGRADVRWVAFRSKANRGVGLLAMPADESNPPMQMSVSYYTSHELDQAMHNEELKGGQSIEVCAFLS